MNPRILGEALQPGGAAKRNPSAGLAWNAQPASTKTIAAAGANRTGEPIAITS
jgi:hypothetical protein